MSERGPWSVKGIDNKARAAARDAARLEGVTLGEYLNKLILDESRDDRPNDMYSRSAGYGAETTLDQLARRVEAAEARSTLAITGIDQSVMGLVARLERTEDGQSVIAGHVDGVIDELRETHAALSEKVRQLEADESGERNLEALKSLEEALGKLASHVYQESGQAQEETDAIKGRVEAGFMDLNERVEAVETRIESTLTEAARRVEKAVEQAELRTEGSTRHLSERFTALEANVAERLSTVDGLEGRVSRTEDDVSGALSSMESTLVRIQDRLNRAETTTDAALKGLEQTFVQLDSKVEALSETAGPQATQKLRDEIESRFQGLSDELKLEVMAARNEMARQIAAASTGHDPEAIVELQNGLTTVNQRISEGDEHVARAVENMGDQISRISDAFDKRLRSVETASEDGFLAGEGFAAGVSDDIRALSDRFEARFDEIEAREASTIERVGEEVGKLADRLEIRVEESEQASARAIEDIGEQVASVTRRLQGRQDEAFGRLSAHVEETRTAQETRLSDALAQMSERFEKVHEDASAQLSPVQKAIASLAERLDTLESQTDGVVDAGEEDDLLAAFSAAAATVPIAEPEPETESEVEEAPLPIAVGAEGFTPGIPEWSLPAVPTEDADEAPRRGLAFGETLDDPLSELVEAQDIDQLGAHEARDEDVFEELSHGAIAARSSLAEQLDLPPVHLDLNLEPETEATDPDGEPEQVEVVVADPYADDVEDEAQTADDAAEEAEFVGELEEDIDASDYIARARKAAIAAATSQAGYEEPAKGRFGGRLPLYAAASVVALTAAGAAGIMLLRGKQAPVETSRPTATASVTPTAAALPDVVDPVDELTAVSDNELSVLNSDPLPLSGADLAAVTDASTPAEPVQVAELEPQPITVAAVNPVPQPVVGPTPEPAPLRAEPVSFPAIPTSLSLEVAANTGNRVAQYELGLQRLDQSRYAQAAELIEASARQGLPAAQYRLSKLHEQGLGVARDLAAARSWTERAAQGGNVRAMHDLAVFYADGEGGPQSYASAAEWFRKAAEFGVVDSQFNLGVLYQQGLGLTADAQEALYWFAVAAGQGDPGAPQQVSNLSRQMPGAVAADISNRAQTWQPSIPDAAANGEFGDTGFSNDGRAQIEGVQMALTALGYDLGTPDGVAGPATEAAIRAYQGEESLPVTGQVDPVLIESLNRKASGAAS